MRIAVLMENTLGVDGLAAEHGLSLYLEVGDRRVLFDAGQTDAFWENAERSGIDLNAVDTAILSHGHYDHGGGMQTFLARNSRAPLYLTTDAFGAFYSSAEKYIGLDSALQQSDRLYFCGDETPLGDGMTLLTCNTLPRPYPTDSAGLTVHTDTGHIPDNFTHEQYLLIEENNRRILISGCSHKGIQNLVTWFHPDILIGGFHFKKLDPASREGRHTLNQAATFLRTSGTTFYTCHCTGEAQYTYLATQMGDRLHYIRTGDTLTL